MSVWLFKKKLEAVAWANYAQLFNKIGKKLGDPNKKDDAGTREMYENYLQIVEKLDRHGCNLVLILSHLVNDALKVIEEQHKRGVN
jgi:hypothetical protein